MTSYQQHENRLFSFQRDRLTWAVQRLILANIAVFVAMLALTPFTGRTLLDWMAFTRADVLHGAFPPGARGPINRWQPDLGHAQAPRKSHICQACAPAAGMGIGSIRAAV